jgi:hypothetical protein
VAVALTCPSGQTYCDGTVTLTMLKNGHNALTLGQSHFHISGGGKVSVNVVLSNGTLIKLGKATTSPVAISATATNEAERRAAHGEQRRSGSCSTRRAQTSESAPDDWCRLRATCR